MSAVPAWVVTKCEDYSDASADGFQRITTYSSDEELHKSNRAEVVVTIYATGAVVAEVGWDDGLTGFTRAVLPRTTWEEIITWVHTVVELGGFDQ